MFREFLNIFGVTQDQSWRFFILTGVSSFLIGVLILFVPEILVAFIASIFFIIGTSLIFAGWKIRKMFRESQSIRIEIFD